MHILKPETALDKRKDAMNGSIWKAFSMLFVYKTCVKGI